MPEHPQTRPRRWTGRLLLASHPPTAVPLAPGRTTGAQQEKAEGAQPGQADLHSQRLSRAGPRPGGTGKAGPCPWPPWVAASHTH